MPSLLNDQGRIVRHGGSIALRQRLVLLLAEMRRTNADIAALWEIYERAKQKEAEQCPKG